jgi:hypothetical protein
MLQLKAGSLTIVRGDCVHAGRLLPATTTPPATSCYRSPPATAPLPTRYQPATNPLPPPATTTRYHQTDIGWNYCLQVELFQLARESATASTLSFLLDRASALAGGVVAGRW